MSDVRPTQQPNKEPISRRAVVTDGPSWDTPAPPQRCAALRRVGTRDDACRAVLDLRRLDVFERVTSATLAPALAKYHATEKPGQREWPRMVDLLERIGRAINVVPERIGFRRVKDQLTAGGAAALDHLELATLIPQEAQVRDQLCDYVNLAATDSRLEEFEAWAQLLVQKIGKNREPEQINYQQARDLWRTSLEPLAALNAARLWPDSKVGLGNDVLKPSAGGATKSFDLTVRQKGMARSNVEVTTATEVMRPRDLFFAIQHGVDKAQAQGREALAVRREVSIGVKWFTGRVDVERGRYLDYRGDGTYALCQSSPGGQDRVLYERNIVRDDFPQFLSRHRDACVWLESVNIFTADGTHAYSLSQGRVGWEVDVQDGADPALLALRRARRQQRGRLAVVRPRPLWPTHSGPGGVPSMPPKTAGAAAELVPKEHLAAVMEEPAAVGPRTDMPPADSERPLS